MPRKHVDISETIAETTEIAEVLEPDVVTPPTLHDAFFLLCAAMETHLEDNQPSYLKCREIQAWYVNGNHAISWQHAAKLLEEILGVPLGK